MLVNELEPGDIVFAAKIIRNDGSLPGWEENALVAEEGQRGVIINTGYLEDRPDKNLFLVRFEAEGNTGELGPAVACWPEELRVPKDVVN